MGKAKLSPDMVRALSVLCAGPLRFREIGAHAITITHLSGMGMLRPLQRLNKFGEVQHADPLWSITPAGRSALEAQGETP